MTNFEKAVLAKAYRKVRKLGIPFSPCYNPALLDTTRFSTAVSMVADDCIVEHNLDALLLTMQQFEG
jgi:hypothetical protein